VFYFWERLYVPLTISLLVLYLFRWLIHFWFNFGWINASKNLSVSSRSSLLDYRYSKYSPPDYYSNNNPDFISIFHDMLFFISNSANLNFFPLFLFRFDCGLTIIFIFLKKQLLFH
jgi:hypothetical protein